MKRRDGRAVASVHGAVTEVLARILTDPAFAEAVHARPSRALAPWRLPTPIVFRLGDPRPEQWIARARAVELVPGKVDETLHPPPPHAIRAVRLWNGRPIELGRKIRGLTRTASYRETIRRAERVSSIAGVTRTSNTTGVDRVGIPVWTTIRPDHPQAISTFNGKGVKPAQARAGALMEALERYTGERPLDGSRIETPRRLGRRAPAVSPAALGLVSSFAYDPDQPVEWTQAWDLVAAEHVWVPAAAVVCPYRAAPGVAALASHTSGLASGNTLGEAICHGLAELIERDADNRVAVRAYLAPIARELARAVIEGRRRPGPVSSDRYPPHLDLQSVPPIARRLVERFESAGIDLSVLDITSNLGIPAFRAIAIDRHVSEREVSNVHGAGAHPSADVALVRALTEAAQSRSTIIQGAREDVDDLISETALRPRYTVTRRGTRRWHEIASCELPTIRGDIHRMLAALSRAGLARCLVKDLTRPELRVPVVRVIVPGLEEWAAWAMHGQPKGLGERASAELAETA